MDADGRAIDLDKPLSMDPEAMNRLMRKTAMEMEMGMKMEDVKRMRCPRIFLSQLAACEILTLSKRDSGV